MVGSVRKFVLAGALAALLGTTVVQSVGTTSAGAVNFDPCRRWTFYLVTTGGGDAWPQAKAIARRLGGKLAVIQSHAENMCADAAIEAAGYGASVVWIGGSDIATEGTWRWDGGTAADARRVFWIGASYGYAPRNAYENWEGGEPSGGGENCAMMYASGTWNDLACGTVIPFLVEY